MNIDKRTYFTFVIIPFVIFMIVMIIPFVIGIIYSFTDFDGLSKTMNFIGLSNYVDIFSDSAYLNALLKTFLYAILAVISINLVGLGFALLVTSKLKSINFLRISFFFPNLIGGLILGFIWNFIFSNVFLYIGENITLLSPVFFNWLTQPVSAFLALVFVTTWTQAGYVMVVYIAAIQSIPQDVIEASEVDGASGFSQFIKIKLPLIMSGFTVSLFVTLSNAFKVYDLNLSLTDGGPFGTTILATLNIVNEAFSNNDFSYAQAKAIVLFLIIAIITSGQVYYTKKREVTL